MSQLWLTCVLSSFNVYPVTHQNISNTTTATFVLMPLSWLAGVGNFCFNAPSSFLSIVRILSSQAISFQILLYALFPRFPWSTLLSFPSYFNFHNLTYLGIDVSTHDMTIPPQTDLNYDILDLRNNSHPITKSVSRHPINKPHPTHHPDHTTLHPTQPRLIGNSKFPRFTTVQQNWSNIFPCCFKDKPCFPANTARNSLNFFHALPILALTASDVPP